jgi:hypothetical protein
MVSWKPLDVTLYIHCLFCLKIWEEQREAPLLPSHFRTLGETQERLAHDDEEKNFLGLCFKQNVGCLISLSTELPAHILAESYTN